MHLTQIFLSSNKGWTVDIGENLPMAEREDDTEVMMKLPE
jgi:hypothetical protein